MSIKRRISYPFVLMGALLITAVPAQAGPFDVLKEFFKVRCYVAKQAWNQGNYKDAVCNFIKPQGIKLGAEEQSQPQQPSVSSEPLYKRWLSLAVVYKNVLCEKVCQGYQLLQRRLKSSTSDAKVPVSDVQPAAPLPPPALNPEYDPAKKPSCYDTAQCDDCKSYFWKSLTVRLAVENETAIRTLCRPCANQYRK